MTRFLLTHAPEPVQLRLQRRNLRRGLRAVSAKFAPQLKTARAEAKTAEAKNTRDRRRIDQIEFAWQSEASEFSDALAALDTQELLKRARRHHIDTPVCPAVRDPFTRESGDWIIGEFGDDYLKDEPFRNLEATLKNKEKGDEKWWRERCQFWFGIVATIVGLALSVYNVADVSKSVSDLRKEVELIRMAHHP